MHFDGSQFQNEIYVTGESPWPVGADDWEALASEKLEPGPFGYIAGGAGNESTLRANREAFEQRRLRPRMLAGNSARDLSVEVLGTPSPFPFFLAPVGVLSIAHPDGELDAPRWFQLYWVSDREVVESLVHRAEASGYSAIVVTLDTLTLGWRPRDLRNGYLPFRQGEGIAQFTSDPVFRSRLSVPPEEDPLVAAGTMLAMFPNLAL